MPLTQEQIKQGYSTIKGNYDPLTGNVITPASLQPQPTVEIPPAQPDTTNYGGITGGVYDSIQNEYNNYKTATENAQKAQVAGGSDILSIMNEITGKTGYSQNADELAGVNKATEEQNKYGTQLADLNAQATSLNREAQAIPIQVQQDFANTGATDRGVAPITTGKLRENALKALSIAQQSDIASAALTGSQIRLQAAKDKAQQIVDLKFKPLEDTLAIKQKQYDLNKDILEAYDKKRAEALAISIDREKTQLAEQKQTAKDIQGIALTLSTNGVDQSVIDKVLKSKNFNEAISVAGANLRDPKAKYELEKLRLDNILTNEKIATEQKQRSLLGEPTAESKKKEKAALASVQGQNETLKGKVELIDAILGETNGLKTRVGTNFLSRTTQGDGFFGGLKQGIQNIAKVPLTLGSGTAKDISASVTGAGQRLDRKSVV